MALSILEQLKVLRYEPVSVNKDDPNKPLHGDDTLNLGFAGYFALILVAVVIVLIVIVIGCSYLRQKTSRSP